MNIFKRLKKLEKEVASLSLSRDSLISENNKLRAKFRCLDGKHEHEFKEVGVGVGTHRRGEFGSSWTHYDEYRPVKACKHCDNTINLMVES